MAEEFPPQPQIPPKTPVAPLAAELDASLPAPGNAKDEGGPESLAISFFLILFLGTIAAFIYVFFDFVTDIILALLFVYLSRPLYQWFMPRLKKAWLASSLVCVIIVFLVLIPTAFLVGSLSAEAVVAFDRVGESVAVLEEVLFGDSSIARTVRRAADFAGVEYSPKALRDLATGAAGAAATFLGGQINTILGNVFAILFHFVMMMVMVFYLLIDGGKLKRYIYRLSPLPTHEEELIATQFGSVGRAILFGNGIGSLIQGVIGGLTMAAFGLPSAVLWGTVMTIFAFLPLAGIMVVVIPASVFMALTGRPLAAVAFLVVNTVQALFVENVVKTRLIGSHMKMHNLLIFLSLIGGLSVFGVIGILYGPLVVTMFLTLSRLYETHYEATIGAWFDRRA
ncbi:MAG: AI-2E family transporter [Deltaproteobacteria bacterium]